jgi:hypothetical protein
MKISNFHWKISSPSLTVTSGSRTHKPRQRDAAGGRTPDKLRRFFTLKYAFYGCLKNPGVSALQGMGDGGWGFLNENQ